MVFKPLYGESANLESTPFHAGYMYVTSDTERMYVDLVDGSGTEKRICINDDTKYAGKVIYGTLSASGWNNTTQNVVFAGVTPTTSFVWTGLSDKITSAQDAAASAARLRATAQGNGYITFIADGTVPTIDIPVMAVIPSIVQLNAAAENVTYTNATSGLTATNVQDAIDELATSSASGIIPHSIYIDTAPTKTAYKAGEVFDPSGMVVKADYTNGSQIIASGVVITGWTADSSPLVAGQMAVEITYTESRVSYTCTQAITVTKTSVTIPTYNETRTYNGSEQTPNFTNDPGALAAKSGDTSHTNASTSLTVRFTLNDTALYQWSDGTTGPKDVGWSIAKKAPTISVSPTSVVLNTSNLTKTATVTTDGDGAFATPASSNTGVATATISNKIVTISHVNKTSGTATITVTQNAGTNYLSGSVTIAVTASFVTIYGVSWDGTSTTVLSRTDASASFTDPVPALNGTGGSSPFDNLMPWAGMVKETRTGGVMVKIPKFWYKLTQVGTQGVKIQIADGEVDGFSVSPAHMDRGDGKGERDYVYIGRYHCATSTYKSTTGVLPMANQTRATFRTQCKNIGTGYSLADFHMRFTIWLLYIVEFANWNSQATIGYGCGNGSGTENMGYTDSMSYHTGTTKSSRTTYGVSTQYRWIEGLWDNVYDWLGDCYNNSNGLNIINNPANDSDSANGVSVGTPSNGWIAGLKVTTSGPFPMFINSNTSGGGESAYVTDYWGFGTSGPCLYAGGSYSQNQSRGMFRLYYSGTSSKNADFGGRLQELP